MATTSSLQLHPLHKISLSPKYPHFLRNSYFRPRLQYGSVVFPSCAIRASSALTPEQESSSEKNQSVEIPEVFACPVCYEPLIRKGPPGLNLGAIYRSGFKCRKCDKSYSSKDIYLDSTLTAGLREYIEVKPAGTELFRSPLVSFLYERGWRQNFNRTGFPGLDEERALQSFNYLMEGEIEDVCKSCGLTSYSSIVQQSFIMFSAQKP